MRDEMRLKNPLACGFDATCERFHATLLKLTGVGGISHTCDAAHGVVKRYGTVHGAVHLHPAPTSHLLAPVLWYSLYKEVLQLGRYKRPRLFKLCHKHFARRTGSVKSLIPLPTKLCISYANSSNMWTARQLHVNTFAAGRTHISCTQGQRHRELCNCELCKAINKI